MSINYSNIDIRLLVEWLGVAGAKAGLMASKSCKNDVLYDIAKSFGLNFKKNISKEKMIDEIISFANKRIDRTLDDLYAMSESELKDYFEKVKATPEELLEIVGELGINPKNDGYKALVDLVSREISETGRFKRISSSD